MSKIPTKPPLPPSSPSKVVFRPRRTTGGLQPSNPHARNSLNTPINNNTLKVGDRVTVNGKSGTIAFVGPTQFSDGEWVGVNLDDVQGKNDGSYDGVRYFETDPNRGIFCRPDKVQRLSINGSSQRHSLNRPLRLSTIEGASNNVSGVTKIDKQDLSSTKNLQIGDHVIIRGEKTGILKYIGKIHVDEGIWCGIKLDGPSGKHDGQINGKRYFTCPQGYGVFAPLHHVEKLSNNDTHNLVTRDSFISTDSNYQFHEIASQDSHHSELSTSSNENDNFTPRSPKKIKQPNLTGLDKSSMDNLLEKVKEKDLFIENLQKQYEKKDKEYENLIKQKHELTQKIEDLQFQLESNKENLNIPDDYRVLSPDELRIYEQTKDQVIELEDINKRLQQEIDLLTSQVTDLENKEQIQVRKLTEKERSYQEQIKEYQSKIDQMTKEEQDVQLRLASLEEENQAYDQQIDELLHELKEYKENILPDLEQQCEMFKTELQNRNETDTTTLNERELYYEQQIKEYQEHIDKATRDTEAIRAELKQIEEENHLKEQKTNALIKELKENYTKVQAELANQERQVNRTLSQYESQYEQQLNEYENNLEKASRETENIQDELIKLEEDKMLHDTKSNNTINSLKEDYEKQYEILKNQLIELQNQNRSENVDLNERIAHYELEIKEYQTKIDQDVQEIESLVDQLKSLQDEKQSHEDYLNKTIQNLRENQQELQKEIDELNEREIKANRNLHQHETQYEQKLEQAELQIQKLQSELESLQQADPDQSDDKAEINQYMQEIQDLKSKLANLQEEKDETEEQLNKTIDQLKQELEGNSNPDERETHIQGYEQRLEQADLTIQELREALEKLQEEKDTSEEAIDSLRQDVETLKTELEDRDRIHGENEDNYKFEIGEYKTKQDEYVLEIELLQTKLTDLEEDKTKIEDRLNKTIDQLKQDYKQLQNQQEHEANDEQQRRESKYEEQIEEYQQKLEQADLMIQQLQAEIDEIQEEKNEADETIEALTKDIETLKTELQDQDRVQNEHENDYTSEITQLKNKQDQDLLQIQDLQSKLTTVQEEYEKLQNEQTQREKQFLKDCHSQYEKEIDEYQKNLELSLCEVANIRLQLVNLQEEKETSEANFNDELNSIKTDYENQIQILKNQLNDLQKQNQTKERQVKQYQSEYEEIQSLRQCIENLTLINETLKNELEDIKKQNESDESDQLVQQVNALHQMHMNLLEKQANREQEFAEEKKALEKKFQENIEDYEMKLALQKSEFVVELENIKLDHDQDMLKLKAQIPKPAATKGKK